jgi:FkbM family methyltransferase
VFHARELRRRLDGLIRPPRPWDGRHHPALLRFAPWKGRADGRFAYDFLGIRTDPSFRPHYRPQPAGEIQTVYPTPDYTYFELIFVLRAVLDAEHRGRFCVMELGAGFGPWLVTAHRAMALSFGRPVDLVGVEMVQRHFLWLQAHLRENGIDPLRHTLLHAAVSDYEGSATYQPETEVAGDFGQRVIGRLPDGMDGITTKKGAAPAALAPVRVPCVRLQRLLEEQEHVDLLHVDVQGEELRALRGALPELNRCVRRLIVATHSRRIHHALRHMLVAARWQRCYDFRLRTRERTEFGDIEFLDGMLAFENPAVFERSARPEWAGLDELRPADPRVRRPEPSPG